MELAVNSQIFKNINEFETLELIKSKGFENVFICWDGQNEKNVAKVELCQKLNLNIIFVHLDKQFINDIWLEGNAGDEFVEGYKKQFALMKKYNIPMAVMHVQRSINPPEISETGLRRFGEILKSAEENNVILAVENSWRLDYVDCIFENFVSENLKICYDCGHDHAFSNDTFDIKKYADKIVAIHLHDNDGLQDQHLLPFDGNIDWKEVLTKIKSTSYSGPITLEIHPNYDAYKDCSLEELVGRIKNRGEILIEKYKSL